MIWMTWQQHRLQALIGGILLGLLTLFLLVTGLAIASYYQTNVAGCVAVPTCTAYTFLNFGIFVDSMQVLNVLHVLPILIGIFIGAPLVAWEVEHGTYLLAWTQGITRRRWLVVKLGMLIGLMLAAFVFLDGLMLWWSGPVSKGLGPFTTYEVSGLLPLAYALFALTLGIAVGTLVRRSIAAMAITLALFVGLLTAIAHLRTHFLPTLTDLQPYQQLQPHLHDWIVDRPQLLDRLGHPVPLDFCQNVAGHDFISCMQNHGVLVSTTYHPVSQFWAIQGIESGIFLLLAAGSITLALWWIQHRVR